MNDNISERNYVHIGNNSHLLRLVLSQRPWSNILKIGEFREFGSLSFMNIKYY